MSEDWSIKVVPLADRTFYEVVRLGWLVASAYNGPTGWRRSLKPLEPIPADVAAALPEGARGVLGLEPNQVTVRR